MNDLLDFEISGESKRRHFGRTRAYTKYRAAEVLGAREVLVTPLLVQSER